MTEHLHQGDYESKREEEEEDRSRKGHAGHKLASCVSTSAKLQRRRNLFVEGTKTI